MTICPPPVGIGLTDLPNIGGRGQWPPLAPPVPPSLLCSTRSIACARRACTACNYSGPNCVHEAKVAANDDKYNCVNGDDVIALLCEVSRHGK